MDARTLPPCRKLSLAALALVIAGGIWMAAHLPRHVPLGVPIALLAAAGLLLVAAAILLSRVRDFGWPAFRQVFSWALLGEAVVGGMIGLVFVKDGTRGAPLAVLLGMLLVFVLDVAFLLAFSVGRYQPAAG
jgi:hypothetical protein